MTALFLWGALRWRPLLDFVAGGLGDAVGREAVLSGYRVVREEGDLGPILVAHEGQEARGTLWTGLTAEARERIGRFLRSPRVQVMVRVEGATVAAETDAPRDEAWVTCRDWSLDSWIAKVGRGLVGEAVEPSEQSIRLTMRQHRAAALSRGQSSTAPTRVRHRAEPGHFAFRPVRPPVGYFFRFEGLEVDHRRFDEGRSEGLRREVLVGADAVMILPYDRERDRVLLVEQFRTGPARRADPQPWTLEAVAGLIDAGETPEEAGRREAVEEAGLDELELIPMFAGYASPGNATDHFTAFLGLCELPDGHGTTGGLAEEHEDLRLHVLPFEDALALVETGEANVVPLVGMLLWLDRWRRVNGHGAGLVARGAAS